MRQKGGWRRPSSLARQGHRQRERHGLFRRTDQRKFQDCAGRPTTVLSRGAICAAATFSPPTRRRAHAQSTQNLLIVMLIARLSAHRCFMPSSHRPPSPGLASSSMRSGRAVRWRGCSLAAKAMTFGESAAAQARAFGRASAMDDGSLLAAFGCRRCLHVRHRPGQAAHGGPHADLLRLLCGVIGYCHDSRAHIDRAVARDVLSLLFLAQADSRRVGHTWEIAGSPPSWGRAVWAVTAAACHGRRPHARS